MHPNVCNWISSETISCKKENGCSYGQKGYAVCAACGHLSNPGVLRSLGPVVENDEREHNTIKKVAGEVPIPLPWGEQQGNDTEQRKAQIEARPLRVCVSQVILKARAVAS